MGIGFLEVFQLGIGLYVLYAAFTNNKKLFDFSSMTFNDEAKVRKVLRSLYFAMGGVMVVDGLVGMARNALFASENPPQIALPAFVTYDFLETINFIAMGIVLTLIVVSVVYVHRNSTKKK